jgi:hypothetical protein
MKTAPLLIAGLVGGLLGASLIWILQGHSFHLVPQEMSYADLSATLLAAVSALVTILGVGVAILAIWGYSHFKGIAQSSAKEHVNAEITDGTLRGEIHAAVTAFMQAGFDAGQLREILEARVDQILIQGPGQRARENAAMEEEDDNNVDL